MTSSKMSKWESVSKKILKYKPTNMYINTWCLCVIVCLLVCPCERVWKWGILCSVYLVSTGHYGYECVWMCYKHAYMNECITYVKSYI